MKIGHLVLKLLTFIFIVGKFGPANLYESGEEVPRSKRTNLFEDWLELTFCEFMVLHVVLLYELAQAINLIL